MSSKYFQPHLTPSLDLDLTPAPPVGFNLTFECSEDEVFDHDWFAAPFIMMTCQVSPVLPPPLSPFLFLSPQLTIIFIPV